ncbi:MAG: urease accessory protein UreD, partial [Microcoleaceae cyanobacterium]
MNTQTVWQGSLDLIYVKRDHETLMSHHLQQAPLKIQRSFYPEGKEVCHSVMLHTAGGMVGGDRLSVNVDLQSDTRVLITTANAGKVYRSNGLTTQ